MTEINDLRHRVEAAEQRFGLIDEQQQHYSDRLVGLLETIEGQLTAARAEVEIQVAKNTRVAQENEELRGMLQSVLRSIEEKTFTKTLQNLESRVTAMVDPSETAESAAETAAVEGDGEPEAVAEQAVTDEAPAAEETPEEEAVAEEAPTEEATAEEISVEQDPAAEPAFDATEATAPEATAPEAIAPEEIAPEDETLEATAPEAGDPMVAVGEETTEDAAETAIEAAPVEIDAETAETAEHADAADQSEAEAGEGVEAIAAEAGEPEGTPEDAGFEAAAEAPTAEEIPQEDSTPETESTSQEETAIEAPELLTENLSEDQESTAIAADTDSAATNDHDGDPAGQDFSGEAAEMSGEAGLPDATADTDATADSDGNGMDPAAVDPSESAAPEAQADPDPQADQDQVIVEEPSNETPTVKEIIRRVGDLARELERAEVQRKANLEGADQEPLPDAAAELAGLDAAEEDPPMDVAASA